MLIPVGENCTVDGKARAYVHYNRNLNFVPSWIYVPGICLLNCRRYAWNERIRYEMPLLSIFLPLALRNSTGFE